MNTNKLKDMNLNGGLFMRERWEEMEGDWDE
jgi:hypothetical protein